MAQKEFGLPVLVGLLAVSTLSYWMSPLARIALPQTTWPPRVPQSVHVDAELSADAGST